MEYENYADIWKSGSLLTFGSMSQTKTASLSPIYSDKIFMYHTHVLQWPEAVMFSKNIKKNMIPPGATVGSFLLRLMRTNSTQS